LEELDPITILARDDSLMGLIKRPSIPATKIEFQDRINGQVLQHVSFVSSSTGYLNSIIKISNRCGGATVKKTRS
jgi:hypothetical protein